MRAQDFLDWMDAVGAKTAADVRKCLGLSRGSAEKYVGDAKAGNPVDIKETVALAMSAVAIKLAPWGERIEK